MPQRYRRLREVRRQRVREGRRLRQLHVRRPHQQHQQARLLLCHPQYVLTSFPIPVRGWLVLTDGSNASYQGEEGSEEAASQREDISLRCTPLNNDDHSHLFDDDSQDDSNEESDDEGASVGSGSEGE